MAILPGKSQNNTSWKKSWSQVGIETRPLMWVDQCSKQCAARPQVSEGCLLLQVINYFLSPEDIGYVLFVYIQADMCDTWSTHLISALHCL